MVKTGNIKAGYSPDELTGETSTTIKEGRAVAGSSKSASLKELPGNIALEESRYGRHVSEASRDSK